MLIISRSFTLAIILIAIATSSFFTDRALADTVVLSGTHSASELKATCGANGGEFAADGTSYGCKGKGGSVTCSWDEKCTGHCETCGKPGAAKRGQGAILGVLSGTTLKTRVTNTHPVHHSRTVVNSDKPVREISEGHPSKKK